MISIPLANSDLVLRMDSADAALFAEYSFHLTSEKGYVVGRKRGSAPPVPVHRMILGRTGGSHAVIDHIDGDKLNNCRSNLRIVTPHQNSVNRHSLNRNNTSGFRGVFPRKNGTWGAQIRANGKHYFLGYFQTPEDAVKARIEAELKYYGEVCPTNRKAA